MNRLIKSISIILLAAIYCFAFYLNNEAGFFQNSSFSENPASGDHYFFSDGKINLFGIICKNENQRTHSNNQPIQLNFKYKPESLNINHLKELFSKNIASNLQFWENIIIEYLKSTVIIFPFHYFW